MLKKGGFRMGGEMVRLECGVCGRACHVEIYTCLEEV